MKEIHMWPRGSRRDYLRMRSREILRDSMVPNDKRDL